MNTWMKFLIVTLVIGVPAFMAGPMLWPPSEDIAPTTEQLPFFIFLSLVESLFFGFGVAFIAFGWPLVKSATAGKFAKARFAAIAWLLVSWWPHDNFHISNGMNAQGLLYIDYGFHMTLMIAGITLAYSFVSVMAAQNIKPAAK